MGDSSATLDHVLLVFMLGWKYHSLFHLSSRDKLPFLGMEACAGLSSWAFLRLAGFLKERVQLFVFTPNACLRVATLSQ